MLFKNLVIYNFSKSFIIIKCVLDGNRMTYLCLHVGRKLQIVCVNEFIQRFIAKYFMSEVHQFKFIYSEFTIHFWCYGLLTNHLPGVHAGYLSNFYQTSFASRFPDINRFCFQFAYVRLIRFVCNSFMLARRRCVVYPVGVQLRLFPFIEFWARKCKLDSKNL